MRWKVLSSLAAAAVLVGAAYPLAFATSGDRVDCPGKVVCPITGETVCKDRCPLLDADRTDCPGKVECPLDGEAICLDECPVAATATADDHATSTFGRAACCSQTE